MTKKGQAGGIATAKILREKALKNYYKNPSICKFCNAIINVEEGKKVQDAKKKKFCNQKCFLNYKDSFTSIKSLYSERCIRCGCLVPYKIKKNGEYYKRIICDDCPRGKVSTVIMATKSELFLSRKNWQSARSSIQKSARNIFNKSKKPKTSFICSYDRYVEIAHIKPVSKFSDDTLIREINNINNLVPLCPNHHWEYDNGLLNLSKFV